MIGKQTDLGVGVAIRRTATAPAPMVEISINFANLYVKPREGRYLAGASPMSAANNRRAAMISVIHSDDMCSYGCHRRLGGRGWPPTTSQVVGVLAHSYDTYDKRITQITHQVLYTWSLLEKNPNVPMEAFKWN